MTRHGDRAPLTQFSAHLTTPFCGLWKEEDFALYAEYEKMLNSESKQNVLPDVLKRFRQLPPNDKCRPGHLTMLGVVQLLRLGRMLRNIYEDIFPFDDQSTEFFLYTTTFARTYQSGLAFLHGIMDPKIASELSFMGTENVNFCSESWCRCPNFDKFNGDFYHEQGEYYRKSGKHVIYTIEKMNHILKTNVIMDAVMCFDSMMAYACHREPLPCLANGDCVTKDMLDMLNSFIIRRYFDLHTKIAGSNKFFLEAFPIMARWQKLLDSLKEHAEKRSFQYFSGHDVSIAPLLAVLGVFDGHIPPYASNLRVEMIEKIETSKMYLRFIYNGDDLTKRIKLCDGNLVQFGKYYLCDAEQFTKYIRQFLNTNFQPMSEFSNICSNKL